VSSEDLKIAIGSAKALRLKESEVETLEENEAITNLIIPRARDRWVLVTAKKIS
jgi:hypothetical protein